MWLFLRYLLLPFSLIYGSVVWLRNRLYDFQLLPARSFQIPTIVIGNLAVGGTGKSPMTEFVVSYLSKQYNVAILSRGYGRKTKGFRMVQIDSLATDVGDEPLQFKNKLPNVTVAVCEDRCTGIEKLQGDHQLIILDDAYQHRKLSPLFSILLFDFRSFSQPMFVFPAGNFRDLLMESKRAQIIVITKCPANISNEDKIRIEKKMRRYNRTAPITFSHITYFEPVNANGKQIDIENKDVVLVTGIAKPQPLVDHITQKAKSVHHISFGDHHAFDEADIDRILKTFQSLNSDNKILLTTEKDYQRLKPYNVLFDTVELVYLPIGIKFNDLGQSTQFCNILSDTVASSVNQP
ncbi:tetraacyldisaccharide 4'-kinase [Sphingobacterium sp. DR205]|uniref:tetraacyldisaccharide 4'-kinase n=1 Tax=Sphingobacterium sp. DR205 TaxID=2713573 RepID=UPI0013E45664|nr:tetraacyldisaccharide 4'-kinase [Sphingobacterium sp. DR205]QIH31388.1 tetraacyldisaccharide 4'-kinase [Sphingobacterium sp. DR205]